MVGGTADTPLMDKGLIANPMRSQSTAWLEPKVVDGHLHAILKSESWNQVCIADLTRGFMTHGIAREANVNVFPTVARLV